MSNKSLSDLRNQAIDLIHELRGIICFQDEYESIMSLNSRSKLTFLIEDYMSLKVERYYE